MDVKHNKLRPLISLTEKTIVLQLLASWLTVQSFTLKSNETNTSILKHGNGRLSYTKILKNHSKGGGYIGFPLNRFHRIKIWNLKSAKSTCHWTLQSIKDFSIQSWIERFPASMLLASFTTTFFTSRLTSKVVVMLRGDQGFKLMHGKITYNRP